MQSSHHNLIKTFRMPIRLGLQTLQQVPMVLMINTNHWAWCTCSVPGLYCIYSRPLSVFHSALQEGWPLPGLVFTHLLVNCGWEAWEMAREHHLLLPFALGSTASLPDMIEQNLGRSSSSIFSSSLAVGRLLVTCSESWAQKWLSTTNDPGCGSPIR